MTVLPQIFILLHILLGPCLGRSSQIPICQLSIPLEGSERNERSKPVVPAPQRIAVIGSGITGATAAFTISENGRLSSSGRPEITIFERNPIVGGRITVTQIFGEPRLTIDTCAATFSLTSDFCLAKAARDVGLSVVPFRRTTTGVGIWDGEQFQGFIEEEGFRNPQSWPVERVSRWFQRYGMAPWNFATGVENKRSAFRLLGEAKFTSLAREVENQDLTKTIREGVCDSGLLNCTDDKDLRYLNEVVDAGIRERFFGGYSELNSLDVLLALAPEEIASVVGGNLRLIERLVKISGARLRLRANVENLSQNAQEGWNVEWTEGGVRRRGHFDSVIIAAPLALNKILIEPPLPPRGVPDLGASYFDTFVTHFTSLNTLNASYFNVSGPMPQNILTTTETGSVVVPPFFSLTLLNSVSNPTTQRPENLYRLVSEQQISDEELGEYIEQNESLTDPAISWIDRQQLPRSVTRPLQNRTLQDQIEVAPNLFYAGSGEQITGTVEFGCRMGANAANLVFPIETA